MSLNIVNNIVNTVKDVKLVVCTHYPLNRRISLIKVVNVHYSIARTCIVRELKKGKQLTLLVRARVGSREAFLSWCTWSDFEDW